VLDEIKGLMLLPPEQFGGLMPSQVLTKTSEIVIANAEHIAANTEILQHLLDAGKILGPFVVIIIAMGVWAWQKMEKSQEKMELAFIAHVKENDEVHDRIFTGQRDTEKELSELLGEHKVFSKNHKV
jgi:hypothetical protein